MSIPEAITYLSNYFAPPTGPPGSELRSRAPPGDKGGGRPRSKYDKVARRRGKLEFAAILGKIKKKTLNGRNTNWINKFSKKMLNSSKYFFLCKVTFLFAFEETQIMQLLTDRWRYSKIAPCIIISTLLTTIRRKYDFFHEAQFWAGSRTFGNPILVDTESQRDTPMAVYFRRSPIVVGRVNFPSDKARTLASS